MSEKKKEQQHTSDSAIFMGAPHAFCLRVEIAEGEGSWKFSQDPNDEEPDNIEIESPCGVKTYILEEDLRTIVNALQLMFERLDSIREKNRYETPFRIQ